MNKVFASLALTAMLALPVVGFAASFDFNTASAEDMIKACKTEGITLAPAIADAIVKARATTPIVSEEALGKVPGMTPQLIMQLAPIDEGGVLMFDPSSTPGMKGY